jgi:hypothetical protein
VVQNDFTVFRIIRMLVMNVAVEAVQKQPGGLCSACQLPGTAAASKRAYDALVQGSAQHIAVVASLVGVSC